MLMAKDILAVKLIKTKCLFFQRAAEDAGILRERKISVKEAISIKALSRLSMNKIRDLRVSLLNWVVMFGLLRVI